MSSFALVSSADIFGIIDVKKYRSKETGLGICFAHVDGPLVNGYFCLGRNIFAYIFNSYLRKEPFGGGSKFIALLRTLQNFQDRNRDSLLLFSMEF